jgi:hypothetical protein
MRDYKTQHLRRHSSHFHLWKNVLLNTDFFYVKFAENNMKLGLSVAILHSYRHQTEK